jgi:hypothetical protein
MCVRQDCVLHRQAHALTERSAQAGGRAAEKKIEKLKTQMQKLKDIEAQLQERPDQQIQMHTQWAQAVEAPHIWKR